MTADMTTAWLQAAGSIRLLERDEVIALARTIQADPSSGSALYAINKLVASNLRLVSKVWRSHFFYVEAHDPRAVDLLQEGALGLRHAAIKFDYSRGFTFSTYAVAWIRKYMGSFLRDKDRHIRLSADCYSVAVAAGRYGERYQAEHGTKPTIEQVAEACRKSVDSVKNFLEAYERCNTQISLDQPVRASQDDRGLTIGDCVPAPQQYDMGKDKRFDKLSRVVEILFDAAGLSEDERLIVRERELLNKPTPFSTIARLTGMKPHMVRPHHKRCMVRLQNAAKASGISITGTLCRA